MKKTVAVATVFLAVTGTAYGSGWRIPEQSVNSTARAGGYVAYTPGADAAYFNPANMSWLDDRGYLELDGTWIHLAAISYTDNRNPALSGNSEEENFFLPTFFAVSPYYGDFRLGFSFTAPAGLSKQWKDPFPRTFAEEFTLKVFEFNPTLSYKFCEQFAIGLGLRALYADGKVKSFGMTSMGAGISRDLEGDTWEAGYNLSLTARPVEDLHLAVSYRSRVDLDVSGSADLATTFGPGAYSGDAEVSVPVPAVLALSAAYTFFDQLTVELEYDRTYWSEYETLDFNYDEPLSNPVLFAAFDQPLERRWSDTDTFRVSIEYDFKNDFVLMLGFALDENPEPDDTVSFELPDADAQLYSIGLRYAASENLELGIAYLYDNKDDRSVVQNTINGTFTDTAAHLLTFGLTWKI